MATKKHPLQSGRSGGYRQAFLAILIATTFLLLGPSTAWADAPSELNGNVIFSEMTIGRGEVSSPDVLALQIAGIGGPMAASWTLTGQKVVVQQNHSWSKAVTTTSGEDYLIGTPPESETKWDEFDSATLESQAVGHGPDVLIIPNGTSAPALAESTLSESAIKPAAREDWQAGWGEGNDDYLTKVHHTVPGSPSLIVKGKSVISIQGDFSVYVWESTVNVTDSTSGTRQYRSGTWIENAVGPEDTPRPADAHDQLLVLHVKDGLMHLTYQSGLLRINMGSLDVFTPGKATFNAERARIEQDGAVETRGPGMMPVGGPLNIGVGAAWTDEYLEAKLARAIPTPGEDVPPVNGLPSDGGDKPLGENGFGSSSETPTSFSETPIWLILPLWTVVVVVAIAFGLWFHLRRSGLLTWFRDTLPPIVRAEQALFDGRTRHAKRIARRIIRRDPRDADALMILGVAMAQDERYEQLVDELSPAVKTLKAPEAGGIQFLLGLACAHLDRKAEAVKWLTAAGHEPDILERIRQEPTFGRLKGFRAYQRLVARPVPDAAYS